MSDDVLQAMKLDEAKSDARTILILAAIAEWKLQNERIRFAFQRLSEPIAVLEAQRH